MIYAKIMQQVLIEEAPTLWKLLNGVLCLYKPAGESAKRVRGSLLGKLSKGKAVVYFLINYQSKMSSNRFSVK